MLLIVSVIECVVNKINTAGVTSRAGTAYPSGGPAFTPGFSRVRVTRSLVLYVCFVDRSFSFYTFSFTHLFFFDIQILIDCPLVSSNSSC